MKNTRRKSKIISSSKKKLFNRVEMRSNIPKEAISKWFVLEPLALYGLIWIPFHFSVCCCLVIMFSDYKMNIVGDRIRQLFLCLFPLLIFLNLYCSILQWIVTKPTRRRSSSSHVYPPSCIEEEILRKTQRDS